MAVYDVTYQMDFWMKVKAKSEAEAENIAERNPCAPFDSEAKGRKQGILYSAAGEPHDFSVVEIRRGTKVWLACARKRSPWDAAPAKARRGKKTRTGGDGHA